MIVSQDPNETATDPVRREESRGGVFFNGTNHWLFSLFPTHSTSISTFFSVDSCWRGPRARRYFAPFCFFLFFSLFPLQHNGSEDLHPPPSFIQPPSTSPPPGRNLTTQVISRQNWTPSKATLKDASRGFFENSPNNRACGVSDGGRLRRRELIKGMYVCIWRNCFQFSSSNSLLSLMLEGGGEKSSYFKESLQRKLTLYIKGRRYAQVLVNIYIIWITIREICCSSSGPVRQMLHILHWNPSPCMETDASNRGTMF